MGRSKNRKKRRLGRINKQYADNDSFYPYYEHDDWCAVRYYRWCGFIALQNITLRKTLNTNYLNFGECCAVRNYVMSNLKNSIPLLNKKQRYHLNRVVKRTIEKNKEQIQKYHVPEAFAKYFINGMYKLLNTLSIIEDDFYLVEYCSLTLPERLEKAHNLENKIF